MRSSHLFVVLVGIMPVLVFASTVWLTDGAPFDPFGGHAAKRPIERIVPADPAATATGVGADRPGTVERPATAQRDGDVDWLRLRRLANDGNADAALLLVILDGSREHGSRPVP